MGAQVICEEPINCQNPKSHVPDGGEGQGQGYVYAVPWLSSE